MVPKLHAKGRSFKGCAMYVLHDKETTETAERVAWTETRNTATEDPHLAWKLMVAISKDQARLKEQSGVPNTGRKSVDHVLHMTLSWREDESEGLTREEMMRAAIGAIKALGAEDRQAIIAAHTDEPHPHVHVILNRVSAEDGRILPSSKERLHLSKWALEYEQGRGSTLCKERELNWRARDRGEFTRGQPDRPRHIQELEAANQNAPGFEKISAEQRARDAAVGRKARQSADRRAEAWKVLEQRQADGERLIRDNANAETLRATTEVQREFRPRWRALQRQQETALKAFEANEQKLFGRIRNAMGAIEWKRLLASGPDRPKLGEAFEAFGSAGVRRAALVQAHERAERSLQREQSAVVRERCQPIREQLDADLLESRDRFVGERASLVLTHRLELAAERTAWRTRSVQRREAFAARQRAGGRTSLTVEHARAAAEAFKRANRGPRRDDRGHERE